MPAKRALYTVYRYCCCWPDAAVAARIYIACRRGIRAPPAASLLVRVRELTFTRSPVHASSCAARELSMCVCMRWQERVARVNGASRDVGFRRESTKVAHHGLSLRGFSSELLFAPRPVCPARGFRLDSVYSSARRYKCIVCRFQILFHLECGAAC